MAKTTILNKKLRPFECGTECMPQRLDELSTGSSWVFNNYWLNVLTNQHTYLNMRQPFSYPNLISYETFYKIHSPVGNLRQSVKSHRSSVKAVYWICSSIIPADVLMLNLYINEQTLNFTTQLNIKLHCQRMWLCCRKRYYLTAEGLIGL